MEFALPLGTIVVLCALVAAGWLPLAPGLRTARLFVLVGPLVGFALASVPFLGVPIVILLSGLATAPASGLAMVGFIYAVGGPPALLTGLVAGALRRRRVTGAAFVVACAIAGAAASLLYGAVIAGFSNAEMGLTALLGVAGAVSGAVCAWLASPAKRPPRPPRRPGGPPIDSSAWTGRATRAVNPPAAGSSGPARATGDHKGEPWRPRPGGMIVTFACRP